MQAETNRAAYRAIWRWHFYAGLFSIPLVVWLSITGSIYLFRPQIESWLDRPYENLTIEGPHASGQRIVAAALEAVPGATFAGYELGETPRSAVRVLAGRGEQMFRVYVHPASAQALGVADEDKRPMQQLFYLHGELLMGRFGSTLVELAASWAVVLLLTGLYLWIPRDGLRWAGVLYPRLGKGARTLWRDVHATTGVWVSAFALVLIATGLPWAANWGGYLRIIRAATHTTPTDRSWTTSRAEELADRKAAVVAMAAAAFGHHHNAGEAVPYEKIDTMLETVDRLGLAAPVTLSPPTQAGGPWNLRSDAPDVTKRTRIQLDPETGVVRARDDFEQWHWIDRAVGYGIAVHEGRYFGWPNQLLGLATTSGLIMLCVSAVTMWWKRRPKGALGAPKAMAEPGLGWKTAAAAIALGIYLPLFAVSMLLTLAAERLVLRRIPRTREWLGLA